jgi:hypothetical protein
MIQYYKGLYLKFLEKFTAAQARARVLGDVNDALKVELDELKRSLREPPNGCGCAQPVQELTPAEVDYVQYVCDELAKLGE